MKGDVRSNKGFTLSETLITLLLMSIILTAVVTGISAASRAYRSIVLKADGMTLLSTVAVGMEADLSTATNIREVTEDGESRWCFSSGARGYDMYFFNDEDKGQVCVQAPKNVVIPVTTDAAHTDRLKSQISSDGLVYDTENGYFEFTIQIIEKKSDPSDNSNIVAEQRYIIRPY